MAVTDGRPARGLEPEEALKRWSDPADWAAMHEYEDAREYRSTNDGRSPYELRHREYRKRREPLERALIDMLKSAVLVGTTMGDIPDPHDGRFIINKSLWCDLEIDYDWESAAGGGQVFENLEIAPIRKIPRNVTSIPSWVHEELERLDGDAAEDHAVGIVHDADFEHITLAGHDFHLGSKQADVVRQLHEAATTFSPWCRGTVLLESARSQSDHISELFKRQTRWRDLIESDGRGRYRLNVQLKPGWET